MDPIASCIKESLNWSKIKSEHKFDHANFSEEIVKQDMTSSSPKLEHLLQKIKELDEADMKKDGRMYKHFIYSDIKSAYGAKLIGSGLASAGFHHAYSLKKTPNGMSFVMNPNLARHGGNVFATLTSVSFFEKPIGIKFRRALLKQFNKRPENVHGENIRIVVLDSGFREGIDLFDVKYVHLFEPIATPADQKQAIGRATRFCGQKGLTFSNTKGWPLHVFRYETVIPNSIRNALLANNPDLAPATSMFDLFMKFSNLDPRKLTFANELEKMMIFGAVDRALTQNVHNFGIKDEDVDQYFHQIFQEGGFKSKLRPFQKVQSMVRKQFAQYKWEPAKIENGCEDNDVKAHDKNEPKILGFSPTQDFIRHFFTTGSPYKGMLLNHSVGSGKTCSAIATASSTFEKDGYTIIYVTRHTLKGDVWKNMFEDVCSIRVQEYLKAGKTLPEATAAKQRLIKNWMEPMSYKQFSNMMQGKNNLHDELLKRNGTHDPLKKTLVIIDEAHKLYAPDVTGAEKPDIETIKRVLHNSYSKSGKDSARLLLMTATPYTEDPIDLMRLLNLCRMEQKQLPEDFESFAANYLDDNGKFTAKGKLQFLDDISGHISYLNREKDVRSFAYPVIHDINVQMSDYDFQPLLKEYVKLHFREKHQVQNLGNSKAAFYRDVAVFRSKLLAVLDKEMVGKYNQKKQLINKKNQEQDERLKQLDINYKENKETCDEMLTKCEEDMKAAYKHQVQRLKDDAEKQKEECMDLKVNGHDIEELVKKLKEKRNLKVEKARAIAKAEKMKCKRGDKEAKEVIDIALKAHVLEIKAKCKKDELKLKQKVRTNKKDAKGDKKECMDEVKQNLKRNIDELKEDKSFDVKECKHMSRYNACVNETKNIYAKEYEDIVEERRVFEKSLDESLKLYEQVRRIALEKEVDTYKKSKQVHIEFDEKQLEKTTQELSRLKLEIQEQAPHDKSQRSKLEYCLKSQKVRPAYKMILRGKFPEYIDDDDESEHVENVAVSSNIYVIHGHGSEDIKDFHKREKMPNDKVLVVFPVCGRPNWMNTACNFSDVFNDPANAKWISDPLRYKEQIEKKVGAPIRIYLPGEMIPFMSTNLFFNFEQEKTVVMKSGVFQFSGIPEIKRDKLKETSEIKHSLGTPNCFKYIGVIDDPSEYNGQVHHEVFRGNAYKPASQRAKYSNLAARSFKVKDILNELGPGIYYYTGCRSSQQKVNEQRYQKVLDESFKQQEEKNRSMKFKEFKQYLKLDSKKQFEPSPTPEKSPEKSPNVTENPKENPKTPSPKNIMEIKQKEKKEKMQKRQEKKDADNNAEEKQKLEVIKQTIEVVFKDINGINKSTTLGKLEGFLTELENMKQTPRVKKVRQVLQVLIHILQNFNKFKDVLMASQNNTTIDVFLTREYIVNNKKIHIGRNVIASIPKDTKDVQTKCDAQTIIRRLKKLHDRGALGEVLRALANKDKTINKRDFVELCNLTRKLVLQK